ncbi:hypothetical protein SLEP1_g23478 [Rubroshorea leprosula]|uniref:Uncharacterized protein n=1 Tax=Rubroshorea leprosula TaxID=152421 RepID=A0AAV5JLA8_9ROSI|nr:hypothetical protein SLEP1_g23478 [Rubroshorea leprosula]
MPGIQYCINSPPPWLEALVLGFQHYLFTLGMTLWIPIMIAPQMGGGNAEKVKVIQSLLFASGLNTLFQSLFGTRLPVVAVDSYAYLIPITSIIQGSRYSSCATPIKRFVYTMKGIQGALIITACFQAVVGFLGLRRNAVRFLYPLSVVPFVTLNSLDFIILVSLWGHHLGFHLTGK